MRKKNKIPDHGYRITTNGKLFVVQTWDSHHRFWQRVSQYVETKEEAIEFFRERVAHYEKYKGPWEPIDETIVE